MKSIDKIIDLGCVFYGVTRAAVVGRLRDDRTARVRFSIIGALRAEGYSCKVIGKALNRDHTSAIWAAKNLTPESMAELWPHHVAFLNAIQQRDDFEESPIPDVIQATRLALADIDKKLDLYARTKLVLQQTLADLETVSTALRQTKPSNCSDPRHP